jgi:O-succinylbenzoic acid--CoA ligase
MSRITSYSLSHTQALLEQGVKTGDLVAVITPSSLTISQLLYAAHYLGVALFPLNPSMAVERRNALLLQAGVGLILTDVELDNLPDGVRSVPVSTAAESDGAVKPDVVRSQLQLIVATSGSEGEPKGVMLSGENIAASVTASRNRLGLCSKDIWLNCLPMFHIGGIMILYRCMDAGAAMLLHQGFDAEQVWADLHKYLVSHLSLVPAMLSRLLDVSADAAPPETLRVVLIGGSHFSPELALRAHAAGWPLCVSYGMSETCSNCVTHCGERAGVVPGHVGLPLDGFEVALSANGRIKLRGPAVMQGYLNPERLPGLGFTQDGWLETGDLGEKDRAGCLRVLGRADDMLVSGGNSVHPIEVEEMLLSCPGVDEVAVSARKDKTWGDLLVAIYTGTGSLEGIKSWCYTNLSSYQRPREFIRVPELPRNAMGKLDRESLKALLG